MLTVYDGDSNVLLTLAVHRMPLGWRVVWRWGADGRAPDERVFPTRREAGAFVRDFLDARLLAEEPGNAEDTGESSSVG